MKFSFLNSFFFYSNESNQFANMCTEENSLRQPEEARGNQNITQGKNVQILSYVYGKKLIFNHIIHSHNSVFFMDTIIYLSPSSSSSGAMLYSVGDRDHVLPYSTVPCCFQDFNHLACSQPVGKSIGHLLSLFPSAAFSFHHSCCYEMF